MVGGKGGKGTNIIIESGLTSSLYLRYELCPLPAYVIISPNQFKKFHYKNSLIKNMKVFFF